MPAPNRLPWVAAFTAILVVLLPAAPSTADPETDKDRVDRDLQQAAATLEHATARAQDAMAALNSVNQQLPAAQEALDQAEGSLIAAQVEAADAQRAADAAELAYNDAESALLDSEAALAVEQNNMDQFAATSYEGGYYLSAAALLTVKGPESLIAAMEYVDTLAAARDGAVDGMRVARLDASERRADMLGLKRQADDANAAAHDALRFAEEQERAARDAESHVRDLISQQESAVSVAEQERAASQANYDEVQAESERLAEALRAAASQPAPQGPQVDSAAPPARDGRLTTPVQGWKSSDFGNRFDPYFGQWQLHAGTDFAAPNGAPIYASESGRVVRTGWNGGYGNYTCIYHGQTDQGGLSTCYAHQSAIYVSAGEWVERGQTIGGVGTTGASTGYHLHFEVRLDGSPVDPMGWL